MALPDNSLDIQYADIIALWSAHFHRPLSLKEMAFLADVPMSTMQFRLKYLEDHGLLTRPSVRVARGITITEDGIRVLKKSKVRLAPDNPPILYEEGNNGLGYRVDFGGNSASMQATGSQASIR